MAQKQMLEIGKALSQEPSVLVLDEPTASLTRREIEQLFALVMRLRAAGTAILYVTHHLREVLEIADHVSIIRDGRIVANRAVTRETTEAELVALLIGRAPGLQPAAPVASARVPLLKVSNLRTSSGDGISFHVNDGEIVGFYGVVGCGREQTVALLLGCIRCLAGDVELAGETYMRRTYPADALARGVGFLSSDRKQEGILPNRSIRENLMLSSLRAVARHGFIRQRLERTMVADSSAGSASSFGSEEHSITTLWAATSRRFCSVAPWRRSPVSLSSKIDGRHRYRRQPRPVQYYPQPCRRRHELSLDVERSHRNAHAVRSRLRRV